MNPLLLSASELAHAIQRKELSSLEVVDAHIDQVRRVNPKLNAVVANRFDAARREAKKADARVGSGDPLPLLGVPFTVKECFEVQGMPNTAGVVARRGVFAKRDATAVARLRAAGAIPIGVTNTSELCLWIEAENRLYGRTSNPYDPSRTAGGSSGGEGAIIGAGASPCGIGSDVGGSIRMPAFFNGVFGHKPSGGLVPNTGQHPATENEAQRYLTTGPLARRASDLWPLIKILAGPDGECVGCENLPLGDPDSVDLSGLVVLNVASDSRVSVSSDLRKAQRDVADHLKSRGATIHRKEIPELRHAIEIFGAMMDEAHDTPFREMLGGGKRKSFRRELLRLATGRSEHTLTNVALLLIEHGSSLSFVKRHMERMKELVAKIEVQLHELLGPHGIMLYPPYATPAPKHKAPLLTPNRWSYTPLFNVLLMPVTQVPLGLNAQGLPLGIQVASTQGNDHLTVAVALELERIFGGWKMPA